MDIRIQQLKQKNMKAMNCRRWILFIGILSGLFFSACSVSDDPEPKNYTYFVSNESKTTVTAQEIRQKIMLAQMLVPQVAPFAELAKNDVDVQKIVYKTPFQDKSIKASGLVYLPKTPGEYPVLSFQNGTATEHSMAPSVNGDSEQLFMLQCVASMGYIVVIPDYIGFGESSSLPHPYFHAESTTLSILNMLRAMKEYTTENDLPAQPAKDLFLFGYSQGGWATLLLQKEIETKLTSEFDLKASASAAGPYSLDYMYGYITGRVEYPAPYFTAYLVNAYASLGLVSNPVGDFFREPYAQRIPGLFDGSRSSSNINSYLSVKTADLLTPEFKEGYWSNSKFASFKSALEANSVKTSDWQMTTPTRLFHGEEDLIVPMALSQKTITDLKAAGTPDSKIQLVTLPKIGHTDGTLPIGVSTILWFMEINQ